MERTLWLLYGIQWREAECLAMKGRKDPDHHKGGEAGWAGVGSPCKDPLSGSLTLPLLTLGPRGGTENVLHLRLLICKVRMLPKVPAFG